MKYNLIILVFLTTIILTFGQTKDIKTEYKKLEEKTQTLEKNNQTLEDRIRKMEFENQNLLNQYNSITSQYQQTNDRLNNYLTFTGIIASIFGVLIALAGIYIGFESLRSQNRRKDAIKTLEDAKNYVNDKKSEFDSLISDKEKLLQSEYDKIIQIIKEKLLSDIAIETSKLKEVAEKKTEEIQSLSIEQETNKTIELLEKRLEFFENVGIPDDPEILFSKAKLLREKKMHQEAIKLLEKIVEKIENHSQAYWHLGFEYAEIGDIENSIKNYKKHLELKPNDSTALNNIALRFKSKGKNLEALDFLNKAIEHSDKKELYYNNRISVLIKLNSSDRVIQDYISLISINPDKVEYYNELIKLLKQEKRNDDVIAYHDKVINHFKEKDIELSNYYSFTKALFLGDTSKEQSAIDIFQSLIDANYKVEPCYIRIADLKNKLGQTKEAIQILSNGILSNSLSSSLHIYKAFIESGSSEDKSKESIDKGGTLINNENYFFSAGRFFFKEDKHNLAKYCYEGAIKLIEQKIKSEKLEEGDIMNYYETLIILQKPLTEFNEKYRKLVVSEKYLIVLTVLDIAERLYRKYNSEERAKATNEIKKLNIEAKDKDLIKWNFNDIIGFIDKTKGGELASYMNEVKNYLERNISNDDFQ
jgi:tetratricopeptide (TPR) repeat protein